MSKPDLPEHGVPWLIMESVQRSKEGLPNKKSPKIKKRNKLGRE